uniref:Protein containing Helix-turn-helix type 3 domain protein n=1 Tax=uncultured organism TaxID=155900 RepID=M1P175_9ZZZZ|nr:protein containing Helix-turn-helix type 3 domain protein [uncultured organism]
MSDIVDEFGKRLRELRKSRDLSQEALSREAGLDRTYVGKIERGEKSPSLKTIQKLAEALEVDKTDLFQF